MPKGPFTSQGRQSTLRTVIGTRDARTGLGYGTLKPTYQKSRQLGSEFPYYQKEESSEEEEEDLDQETYDSVNKKYRMYQPSDFSRSAGNDPFYFAAGNTKLSDCFFRTDRVLQEIAVFCNSMAPIPHKSLYPGASSGLSAGPFLPGSGKAGGNSHRTGTYYGTSRAPYPVELENDFEEDEEIESEEHIFTLEDLAKKKLISQGEKA